MNTKTMRLPPRRFSDSVPNNKRKQRDGFDLEHLTLPPPTTKSPKPAFPSAGSDKAAHPVLSNQLLAGYMAHEFLTRGTLFGQSWDPARPQQKADESRKGIREKAEPSERSGAGDGEPRMEKHQRYAQAASLLKTGEVHIPGIVNPSQLARFCEM